MESLVERLKKRASIRRQIATRKSVQEGAPDRIADLLEEAAGEIEATRASLAEAVAALEKIVSEYDGFEYDQGYEAKRMFEIASEALSAIRARGDGF